MTEKIKAKVLLKDPILDIDGQPVKQLEKVDPYKKDLKSGNLMQKTRAEMLTEAPILTVGEILSGVLMHGIAPSTPGEAAMLNRLAKSISNVMAKNKGEWEVEESQIEQIMKLLEKAQMPPGAQLTLGAVVDMLEQAQKSIMIEQNKQDLK